MNTPVTEKEYPITNRYIFRNSVSYIITLIAAAGLYFLLGSEGLMYIVWGFIVGIFGITSLVLKRSNFHYSLDDKYLNIDQGVFKKSQVHIPYHSIQDVIITQNILDKIFGTTFLIIENFSGSDGFVSRKGPEPIGVVGNRINIPGLRPKDAETLRDIILKQIKNNPSTTSGV